MFPSLPMMPEPTVFSLLTVYLAMGLSLITRYAQVRWGARALSILAIAILVYPTEAHSFGLVPGACGTTCMAQRNYWGQPWGYNSVYYYPQFPYAYQTNPFVMLPRMGGYCWNCFSPIPSSPAMINYVQ